MKHSIWEEIEEQETRKVLTLLTGPTGAGKDALYKKLKEKLPDLVRIITTSSREKRPNEEEGNPYFFVSQKRFEEMIKNDEFFEWVEFRGKYYGTQKAIINDALRSGRDVIWMIETKGAVKVKENIKAIKNNVVYIFLTAPNKEEMEQRVMRDEKNPENRWKPSLVDYDLSQYENYDYLVVNEPDRLDEAVDKVISIIEAKRMEIL